MKRASLHTIPKGYPEFLKTVKARIRQAQVKAALLTNRELILLYWEIGHRLDLEQKKRGWGAAVIPRLSRDLNNELPELKGFSERNIGYMVPFAREYGPPPILQQAVANSDGQPLLPQPVAKTAEPQHRALALEAATLHIPWGHNILLMEKVKDRTTRLWYMQQRGG